MTKAVLFLLLVALVLLLAQFYVPLFKQNQRLREKNIRLDAAIQREEEAARRMDKEIQALKTDEEAVERLAREKLGYGKPGETIFRFENRKTNSVPR